MRNSEKTANGAMLLVLLIFMGLLWLASLVFPARSHDFYSAECCSGNDCGPLPLGADG